MDIGAHGDRDGALTAGKGSVSGANRSEIRRLLEKRPLIRQMAQAGMESVCWRQDHYATGGIVESDERVDEGRKLYWPWCWPRNFVVGPLLAAGLHQRVKRLLLFWARCQRPDGSWLHCYDVRDHKEYPGWPETDNVGYMLWHIHQYVTVCHDDEFLSAHWPMVERAATFLQSQFDERWDLIGGMEEVDLPECGRVPIRYSLHINVICSMGLSCAARLARRMCKESLAEQWERLSDRIQTQGIERRLWDARESVFAFGIAEDGRRITAPVLWMTLMPHFISDRWNDRIEGTLAYLDRKLYDKDARVRKTYWLQDYSPLLVAGEPLDNKYSGMGVWVGGLPVLVAVCLKAGRLDKADEQLGIMADLTHPKSLLIPEHVNTLHPGRAGHYSIYPEPWCHVDSGNLLHLSFFLTLIARHEPAWLKPASGA